MQALWQWSYVKYVGHFIAEEDRKNYLDKEIWNADKYFHSHIL